MYISNDYYTSILGNGLIFVYGVSLCNCGNNILAYNDCIIYFGTDKSFFDKDGDENITKYKLNLDKLWKENKKEKEKDISYKISSFLEGLVKKRNGYENLDSFFLDFPKYVYLNYFVDYFSDNNSPISMCINLSKFSIITQSLHNGELLNRPTDIEFNNIFKKEYKNNLFYTIKKQINKIVDRNYNTSKFVRSKFKVLEYINTVLNTYLSIANVNGAGYKPEIYVLSNEGIASKITIPY